MKKVFSVIFIFSVFSISVFAGEKTYKEHLTKGHAQYMAQNFADAILEYNNAKSLKPDLPDADFFIATTMRKQKRYSEAVTLFNTAAKKAGDNDVNMHAKALYNIGITWEWGRDFQRAKKAWEVYIEYAKGQPEAVTFIPYAEDRLIVIERAIKNTAKQKKK